MSLFTFKEVTQAAFAASNARTFTEFETQAREFLLEQSEQQKSTKQFDIFLSHAYTDKLIVIGLYSLLSTAGYTVYVDWIHDKYLNRTIVSPHTARILRRRMRQCNSLMYATTQNHSRSKWMPWEAGYFHGYDGHVAVIPVISSGSSFSGQEYLGLYPFAEKSSSLNGKNTLKIVEQDDASKWMLYTKWIATNVG